MYVFNKKKIVSVHFNKKSPGWILPWKRTLTRPSQDWARGRAMTWTHSIAALAGKPTGMARKSIIFGRGVACRTRSGWASVTRGYWNECQPKFSHNLLNDACRLRDLDNYIIGNLRVHKITSRSFWVGGLFSQETLSSILY